MCLAGAGVAASVTKVETVSVAGQLHGGEQSCRNGSAGSPQSAFLNRLGWWDGSTKTHR